MEDYPPAPAGGFHNGVLAIHSGALGDLILFGRLIETLGEPVTLVAGGEKARLLVGLGVAQSCLDFDSLPMHEIFLDQPAEHGHLHSLLRGRYRSLISCFAHGEEHAQARLKHICGLSQAHFLPVRPAQDQRGHLISIWSEMMGLPPAPLQPPAWPVPSQWLAEAAQVTARLGSPPGRYIVFHPGSGGSAKCWPADHLLEVIRKIGSGKIVVLGPAELERWSPDLIAAFEKQAHVVKSPTLPVLAGLLANSAAYVGNDSGVSHLAAAVGACTLAIFGPSSPEHFAPLGPKVKIIAACKIANISSEQVEQTLEGMLNPDWRDGEYSE